MYHKSRPYRIFYTFNIIVLSVISLLCLLPLIHVLALSFSSGLAVETNQVTLWPIGFNLDSYSRTLADGAFLEALANSVFRVVLGVSIGMLVTILTAYPLSKMDGGGLKGGKLIAWYFVFTMLFNGGLIPNYILIQKLHLMDSIWALVLPGSLGIYNMILMLNFFRTIPRELEEASLIDGAGHLTTLFRIYIPVSLPSIATIALFVTVGSWNSWFDGLIYMHKENWPLSTLLQTMIQAPDLSQKSVSESEIVNLTDRSLRAAKIFIGAFPILLVYPFLQRFFVKGIVVGAVKG
jgi:ABC-type sugar transport system, permease component